MAIESDVQGADSRLAVKFYKSKVQNTFETEKQGRPIWADVDMVTISVPGDQLTVIDTYAQQHHKDRFPLQWARYQNSLPSHEHMVGTPLDQWPLITPAQAEELRHFKFLTVENIANASDQQIQSVGMVAGMSPYTLRERANKFLAVSSKEADATARDKELEELKKANEILQAQMAEIIASMPKKPGRKPAEVQDKEAA